VAKAQAYPTRPIRALVTAGPGSAVDAIHASSSINYRANWGSQLLSKIVLGLADLARLSA
jgi:tripartite-type tricarboxylate transporter receptor subunit TctC